ncbi:hypothetical protein EJB05_17094 [Eragrostis curvula]|uniref:Uncharacterized protein n=1 Tax=Eragrostis curvula TaxID=38414 RepID=A0A5J9VHY6_9POAL|nr:hypothetical protein EJB05_17094 [Eragrostis curvula]
MPMEAGRDHPHDHLSDLPDSILVSILSLLRLDEAARCTVLASRWRRLFPSNLLLDFNAYMPGCRDVTEAVTFLLAAHPTAPIRSFRTTRSFRDGWLDELARRGVQKLDLDLESNDERRPIPASLFACTLLTRLAVRRCVFPDASTTAARAPHLTRLTKVNLLFVTISDESLDVLLSQCKALEILKVLYAWKVSRVRVRSPSLKVLHCDGYFHELFIEYAPNLERVYGRYMDKRGREKGVHLNVEHAPKLEFLGYLGMDFHAIEIGESIFTEDRIRVRTLMPSLKTLAVEVNYTWEGYINWITRLLELFPCLETLYIRSDTWSCIQAEASDSWDVLRCIPCVENHIQKVVFEVYRGHKWQREMAKFLHGRSRFLKDMEFHCMVDSSTPGLRERPSEEWVRKQREILCLDSRASKDARFLFFKSQLVCNHHDISHNGWYKREYYDGLCTVLASRWRRLFTSTLLLDFSTYMPGRRNVTEAVTSLLAAHPTAPIRSFSTTKHFHDGWLDELARRGVQKLYLDLEYSNHEWRSMPASLFACTSLTHITARRCVFPDASATAAGAPHLTRLTEVNLSDVTISNVSLNVQTSSSRSAKR